MEDAHQRCRAMELDASSLHLKNLPEIQATLQLHCPEILRFVYNKVQVLAKEPVPLTQWMEKLCPVIIEHLALKQ